jgi:acylphosphatase
VSRVTRHLIIRGRVQGVWYRESMRIEAERLGVAGWVRNRRDGSVEAMLQGEAGALDALLRWAWNGPPAARVEAIDMQPDTDAVGGLVGFERRPTA